MAYSVESVVLEEGMGEGSTQQHYTVAQFST